MGRMERDLLSGALCLLQCPAPAWRRAQYRRRFLLWALVGFPHRTARERRGRGDLVFHQPLDWPAMAETKTAPKSDTGCVGARGRKRRMEDHSSQPAASSFPNKSAELSLWFDPNPV